jgi:cell division protein ZapA (FtsZ GTPase activity inhibitor)
MMAGVTRSVRVTIAGQRFSVRTDANPRYVRELASFVSRRIDEAKSEGRAVSTQSLALLAAMSIADELHQVRDSQAKLKRRVREKSETILKVLAAEANLTEALRHEADEARPAPEEVEADASSGAAGFHEKADAT